jgi:hypothetical protein
VASNDPALHAQRTDGQYLERTVLHDCSVICHPTCLFGTQIFNLFRWFNHTHWHWILITILLELEEAGTIGNESTELTNYIYEPIVPTNKGILNSLYKKKDCNEPRVETAN